jgi:peptide-methionine (R)-S-oxide reductase
VSYLEKAPLEHTSQERPIFSTAARQPLSRRAFLVSSVAVGGSLAIWMVARNRVDDQAGLKADSASPMLVTIAEFSGSGEREGSVTVPRLIMSNAEWRRRLTANAYDMTRLADTEIAYSGSYWNLHERGLYRCICCDTALFSSDTKFDSGTGWPSFWEPVARENIVEHEDRSLGFSRTAVSCRRCDAHLGHVFNDGPPPTGERFCMNSASLRFVRLS